MNITEEKVDSLRSKIKIHLDKADIENALKKDLKALSKQVQIKGFRAGMVPMSIVKKMYGNSVLAESLNKTIQDSMEKYVKENNVDFLVSPLPAEGQKIRSDIDDISDIDFVFDVPLSPEIDLSYIDKSPAFTKYKIKVDESMIDDEVMRMRQRQPKYEYPETIEPKDVLTFTVEELDEEGNIKIGGINTVSTLTVDLMKEEPGKIVSGLKKQGSFDYDLFELMDRDRNSIIKNILNIQDPGTVGEIGNKFRLTLNNITRNMPADLNEEFFQKAFGDTVKTEDEMRESIKSDIASYYDGRTDSLLVNELFIAIMKEVPIALPEDILKRWLVLNEEKEMSAEQLEKELPSFIKSIRWNLMQNKIMKEQGLSVSAEEVRDRVKMNLIHQLHSYGLGTMGDQYLEQFMARQMEDKKMVEETYRQLQTEKVLGYVKTKATLIEKEITLEDFNELVKKANESPEAVEA